jgi:hypothetical protein
MVVRGREQIFMPCFSRETWRDWQFHTQQSSLLACKAVRFQQETQGFPPRKLGRNNEIDCWICWPLMVLCYSDVVRNCYIKFVVFTVATLRMTTSEMKCFILPRIHILVQWQFTMLLDSRIVLSTSFPFFGISCLYEYISSNATESPKFWSQNTYSPVECHKKRIIFSSVTD